jgi:two-component system phosphate regulon response regulator OmpR
MNASTDVKTQHLLVVDDDNRIRELLKEYLARCGFRVTAAADAAAARRLLELLDFDLIVLDVMMPDEDGFSLTKSLRARSGHTGRTPILLLTARGDSGDRIEGLSLGADDYLPKPFEPRELVLRIEAILRRAADRPAMSGRITLGACAFDIERSELFRGDTPKTPRYLQTVRGVGYMLAPD